MSVTVVDRELIHSYILSLTLLSEYGESVCMSVTVVDREYVCQLLL